MISMTFKRSDEDRILFADEVFNSMFEIEWFQDPKIQEACLKIDKVEYIDGDYFKHPILGGFPARSLSTGLKTVILAIKFDLKDYKVLSSFIGDNCWQFLKYVPKDKEVLIVNNSFLPFDAFDNGLEIYLTEFNKTVNTFRDYALSKSKYGLSIGEV